MQQPKAEHVGARVMVEQAEMKLKKCIRSSNIVEKTKHFDRQFLIYLVEAERIHLLLLY